MDEFIGRLDSDEAIPIVVMAAMAHLNLVSPPSVCSFLMADAADASTPRADLIGIRQRIAGRRGPRSECRAANLPSR